MSGRPARRARLAAAGDEPAGQPATPAQQEHAARELCLRLLALQPRTRKELGDAMRKRGIPQDVADSVLARFGDVGLVDDAAYARAWVTSRHRGRGLARPALADELRRRGVDRDDVTAAVELIGSEDELAAARELVRKRLPGMRNVPTQARYRRLLGMLARRGYGAGIAGQVVREALAELDAETAAELEAVEGE